MTSTPGTDSALNWSSRYAAGDTPWDLGAAHPELVRRLREDPRLVSDGTRPTLVPGAGRGHDALALAAAGHRVVALDIVADLEPLLEAALAPWGGRFVGTDALEFPETGFGWVWDHTFLCALEPALRPAWGRLMRRAIVPGGLLAALVFPEDKPVEEGGPPHRIDGALLAQLLEPDFELLESKPLPAPTPGRRWSERFMLYRLR